MSYNWLTEESEGFLQDGYLLPGETGRQRAQDIMDSAHKLFLDMLEGAGVPLSERVEIAFNWHMDFMRGMEAGWYSLSSPEWANFGRERGLPISCFGSHVPDTMDGILQTAHEIGMMSKHGGGTSADFSSVRHRGAPITDNGHSEGPVNFMRLYDTLMDVSKQGETRRGSTAVYLSADHPDIMEFLDIRDDGNPIQLLSSGVTIPEGWMQSMIDGDKQKRAVWAKIIQRRSESGMPYIIFLDNANGITSPYHGSNYRVRASNLCAEIMLPASELESFVCCLASMNLAKYDEWKDTNAVQVLTVFLDIVMEEFIRKAWRIPGMHRALNFARNHRALGLGALGWHSYLQQNRIPFGSVLANTLNRRIFSFMADEADRASKALGQLLGEPPVAKELDLGRRNVTLLAIAPTTSSSFILGQISPSIEPLRSNYFIKGLAKATSVYKNPELVKVLEEAGLNTPEVWEGILRADGSVQHLTELSAEDREVFKTFEEISQLDVIVQAATRQEFIDQSQSLNLTLHPDTPARDINQLLIEAWERGVKSLYYSHSSNAAQQFNRDLLDCTSCE